jgi:hypothetical protein
LKIIGEKKIAVCDMADTTVRIRPHDQRCEILNQFWDISDNLHGPIRVCQLSVTNRFRFELDNTWRVRIVHQPACQPARLPGGLAGWHPVTPEHHFAMKILANLCGSSQQIVPTNLDQIIEATTDDLRECLLALKEAQETIKTSLEGKAILDRCKDEPPRQRRARLEQNAELVSSNWQSFHGWSAGRLHRLLLSPKPDVLFVVANDGVRDCLRDRMTESRVSNGCLTILRQLLPEDTPLVQRLAGPEEEDSEHAGTQRTHSVHEELPLVVPQKRAWPFDDPVDYEIEQPGRRVQKHKHHRLTHRQRQSTASNKHP